MDWSSGFVSCFSRFVSFRVGVVKSAGEDILFRLCLGGEGRAGTIAEREPAIADGCLRFLKQSDGSLMDT